MEGGVLVNFIEALSNSNWETYRLVKGATCSFPHQRKTKDYSRLQNQQHTKNFVVVVVVVVLVRFGLVKHLASSLTSWLSERKTTATDKNKLKVKLICSMSSLLTTNILPLELVLLHYVCLKSQTTLLWSTPHNHHNHNQTLSLSLSLSLFWSVFPLLLFVFNLRGGGVLYFVCACNYCRGVAQDFLFKISNTYDFQPSQKQANLFVVIFKERKKDRNLFQDGR